jgi:hypothetical protein
MRVHGGKDSNAQDAKLDELKNIVLPTLNQV